MASTPAKEGPAQVPAGAETLAMAYPEGNFFLFGLFLFYVLYWYFQIGYRIEWLGEIRFEFVLGAFLSVAAFISYLLYRDKARTSLYIWTALLIILMGFMTIFSYDPTTSTDVFVDRVVKFAMMALFIAAFVRSPRMLLWFIAVWLLAFMKMGQEGIHGIITGGMVWENQAIPRLHGATPLYAHPISFSGAQFGTLPFLVFISSSSCFFNHSSRPGVFWHGPL